jgi:hypothetical protein
MEPTALQAALPLLALTMYLQHFIPSLLKKIRYLYSCYMSAINSPTTLTQTTIALQNTKGHLEIPEP